MANRPPSRMAEAAAAVRAVHHLHEGAVIFDDPYALQLTSRGWRMLAKSRLFYWVGVRKVLNVLRPVHGQVLARSRYMEEQLQEVIAVGIRQYVILGAGLDSFAWRQPELAARVRVYELDHPGTQAVKRSRIEASGLVWPSNLEMVPVNFGKKRL